MNDKYEAILGAATEWLDNVDADEFLEKFLELQEVSKMDTKILLTKDKNTNSEVYLLACGEGDNNGFGSIKVMFPNMVYDLYDRDILYIADRAFLMLNACKGTRINVMYPLKLSEELVVRDFLSYWGSKRLRELKQVKWDSFINYWQGVLSYINTLIDFDKYPSRFEYYVDDYTDFDGDLSPQFVVRIPRDVLYDLGLSDVQWFDLLSDLMHLVQEFTIDKHFEGKDEYYWFSKFNITFRYIGED